MIKTKKMLGFLQRRLQMETFLPFLQFLQVVRLGQGQVTLSPCLPVSLSPCPTFLFPHYPSMQPLAITAGH